MSDSCTKYHSWQLLLELSLADVFLAVNSVNDGCLLNVKITIFLVSENNV